MPEIKSLEELKRFKEEALKKRRAKATTGHAQITVFTGTCGIAAGAREAMKTILEVIESEGLQDVLVKQTGCIGLCEHEPIVDVEIAGKPKIRYGHVSPERAKEIMEEHVMDGDVVEELVISTEE